MGNRSAVERRNECAVELNPYAEAAATPVIIAWSRVPRDNKLG